MKDSCSDSSASRKSTAGRHRTPGKVKAESKTKATHVSVKNQKEALHPDIEHILGQSQAHSLPLITALCNDLMTGSTHSSTGSYDTSTLRSSESRSDSRRWSTCGPMETSIGAESGTSSTGTMLVMGSSSGGGGSGGGGCGGRPYSWHSEHFDLDTTLNILPQQRKMAQQHSRPRPLLADPLRLPDSHRSVPQDLCTSSAARGRSVLWTQAISNSGSSAPYGGSLDRCSPQLLAGLIPSRLNSGGHSKTEAGNLSHHKALEENIGIAWWGCFLLSFMHICIFCFVKFDQWTEGQSMVVKNKGVCVPWNMRCCVLKKTLWQLSIPTLQCGERRKCILPTGHFQHLCQSRCECIVMYTDCDTRYFVRESVCCGQLPLQWQHW